MDKITNRGSKAILSVVIVFVFIFMLSDLYSINITIVKKTQYDYKTPITITFIDDSLFSIENISGISFNNVDNIERVVYSPPYPMSLYKTRNGNVILRKNDLSDKNGVYFLDKKTFSLTALDQSDEKLIDDYYYRMECDEVSLGYYPFKLIKIVQDGIARLWYG